MKTIVMLATFFCLGSSVLLAKINANTTLVEVVNADEALVFTEIDMESIPSAVSGAFKKSNEAKEISAAYVAKASNGELVYKISAKDSEGKESTFLYNPDGTKYSE